MGGRPRNGGDGAAAAAPAPEKPYEEVTVFFGTTRRPTGNAGPNDFFSGARGRPQVGVCKVAVPRAREPGTIPRPGRRWLVLREPEDPARHVMMLQVSTFFDQQFDERLKAAVRPEGAPAARDVLLFVHGFNNTFDDAARRCAQIAVDVEFDGVPMMYSWPTRGEGTPYASDMNNAEWAAPHLAEFLKRVAADSGARKIYVIAHSMGTRVLCSALRDVARGLAAEDGPLVEEVILAAADIDRDVFVKQLLPEMRRATRRSTLYASSKDRALAASKRINGYPRAGDSTPPLVMAQGLDTVDASGIDTSWIGHAYVSECEAILKDIRGIILEGKQPADRGLRYKPPDVPPEGLRYYVFP